MRARVAATLAISGMLMLLLLASLPPVKGAHGDPLEGPYGGALRVGVLGAISLNPFTTTDATSWKVIPLVYDSLARIDPATLEQAPWAASSWSISGSSLTVILRGDLRFHDATSSPVTAADVVYSYNQYRTAGMVPADLTVAGTGTSVTLTSATGAGLLYGGGLNLPIVKSGSASSPVGSGPWRPPATVSMPLTLTANGGHFWPPYLETVTFSQHADITAASRSLLSGSLDFLGTLLGPDDPGAIHVIGGVNRTLLRDANIVTSPGLVHHTLGFKMAAGAPTSDRPLRVALANLLDPNAYGRFFGLVSPSRSPIIQENFPWYNPDVPIYRVVLSGVGEPVLTESIAILGEAGYADRDGDGFREAPDGSALTLTVVGVPSTEDARTFSVESAIVNSFRKLGLNVVFDDEPSASLPARLLAGNYDAFVLKVDTTLDPGFLNGYLRSTGPRNYFRISSPTLTGYLNSADAALSPAARQTAVDQIQTWTMTEAFFLPQLHVAATEATVRGPFEGWANMPGGVNNFWTYQTLHATHVGDLRADVTMVPNSVTSGGTTQSISRVFDQDGRPVSGATVTFWIGGNQVASGTTGVAGNLEQLITAPNVDGPMDTEVRIVASKVGYTATAASALMTVHPDVLALIVAVSASGATIASGASAPITVTVTAQGAAVAGAEVSVTVTGQGGQVGTARGTTNAQGQFPTTFTGDVGPRTQFQIEATATAAGYLEGTGRTTIVVEQRVGSVEPRIVAGLDISTIIVAVLALVVIGAVAAMMRRKK